MSDVDDATTALGAGAVIRIQPPAPGRTLWLAFVDGELQRHRHGKDTRPTPVRYFEDCVRRNGFDVYDRNETPFGGTSR